VAALSPTPPGSVPGFAIARPGLMARLDAGVEGKLTSLVAPPGYGKSVLLRQWAANRHHRAPAWLTVDRRDDHGERLATRLVTALDVLDPGIGRSALERVDGTGASMGDHFIAQIIEELDLAGPGVLVVDELDTVGNVRLLEDLRALIEHSAPSFRVVLATRVSAAQLRLEHATELRHNDLAFSREEVALLLGRLSGQSFTDDQIDALAAKTEGWPAAVQLAALALRDGSDPDAFIEWLSGDDQLIGRYLTDEVLSGQPERVRSFLLQTSVLGRLSGPLCDAVTGGDDGAELIDLVDRGSMFLVRTGDDGWYRYHRLFRDLTRHELHAAHPDLERGLLCSAADWHLEQGQLDVAVAYLGEAEDWDRVLDLVGAHGRSLFERGQSAIVLRWLESVPERVRAKRSSILLEEVVLLTVVGHTLRAEERAAQLERSASLTAGERIVLDALRSTWVQWHASTQSAIAAADRAMTAIEVILPDEVPDLLGLTSFDSIRNVALASRARARWYEGDTERSRHELATMVEGGISFAPWLINVLGALALIDAWDGRLHEAHHAASRALVVASRADLVGHQSTVDPLLALAAVFRERGALGRSELMLDQALGPIARVPRSVPLAIHTVERALLDLAQGEPGRGLQRIGRFLSSGHRTPPRLVAARLDAVEARLRLVLGDTSAAERLSEGADGLWTGDQAAVAVQVAASRREIATARDLLATWPRGGVRSTLEHRLWTAVVDAPDGDRRASRRGIDEVVTLAEHEGSVLMFVDAGPDAVRLLRGLLDTSPSPYVRRLVQRADERAATASAPGEGAALSERELLVLRYLPTRLSNAEIAAALFVSLNTVKTHLRSIYRRLEVSGRRQAVEAAEGLGLL
jgi:ATP/maltotriose-dependent transcriptional regulator MalT